MALALQQKINDLVFAYGSDVRNFPCLVGLRRVDLTERRLRIAGKAARRKVTQALSRPKTDNSLTHTKGETMNISEKAARELLVEVGYVRAEKCNQNALMAKLADLPNMLSEELITLPTNDNNKTLLNRIMKGLSSGETITILDEVPEESPKEAPETPISQKEGEDTTKPEKTSGKGKRGRPKAVPEPVEQRMNSTEVKRVPIDQLTAAPWNPPHRSDLKSKPDTLEKSMAKLGIIDPLKVTTDYGLIDGHRRLARAKRLGWKDVPCLIVSDENKETLYADLNASSKHLAGKDILQVYNRNRKALTEAQKEIGSEAKEDLGTALLKKIEDAGGSFQTYKFGRSAAKYCGLPNDADFITKTVEWILANGAKDLRLAMRTEQPSKTIKKHILAGTPIKLKMQTEE